MFSIQSCIVVVLFLLPGALFFFVFSPLGLGPEPEKVLSPEFFTDSTHTLRELDLLVDGKKAFREIFSAVDAADTPVHIQTYIWKDDATGREMAARLKAAADRGVRITVSKDMLGTFFELGEVIKGRASPVFTRTGLKDHANIQVSTRLFADTDHSKYFIFEGSRVFFGGMNIADEYHVQWHDYMVLLRGKDWTDAFTNKVLGYAPWPYTSPLVLTVNDAKGTEIRTALIEIIDNAQDSVVIEHAYFSDTKVIDAVRRAAARSVQVKIILPKTPDTHLYANMATINRLLVPQPSGTIPRIFLYPRMSHAKVIMTDGRIAAIGSANLTPRSMLTSKEVTMFVHGSSTAPLISDLREKLEADIAASTEVTTPFTLGPVRKIQALAEKFIW